MMLPIVSKEDTVENTKGKILDTALELFCR